MHILKDYIKYRRISINGCKMIKEERQIVAEFIAASFVQSCPLFELAANIELVRNLKTIKSNILDDRQKRLLTTFLTSSKVQYDNLSDREIINLSCEAIDIQFDDFYSALRYGDPIRENTFSDFNKILYEESKQYISGIEPNYRFSNAEYTEIRISAALVLINELKSIIKLLGNKGEFKFKDRMFKNQERAPLPELVVNKISSLKTGELISI